MGGAGLIIIFVVFFAGCTIWTGIFLTFAAHYFLTIITESSAGIDEIQFPSEGIMDWWWKPVLCLLILAVWIVPTAVLSGPLLAGSPIAFGVGLGILLALLYPVSLLSTLYAQNWFFFLHPQVLWRLARHLGAFVYVHAVTMTMLAAAVGLIVATFLHSFLWALPASFAIPSTLLLYARHWGRFAWLALNFEARPKKKKKRAKGPDATPSPVENVPELDVEEIEPTDAIAEGLPPAYPSAIQASAATPAFANEEEDEWSTNKAPYGLIEEEAKPQWQESTPSYVAEGIATDQPLSLSKYYDEEAKRAAAAEEKKLAETGRMPPLRNKKPSFPVALVLGVWQFMIYSRTLSVWVNLVFLTAIELFFLLMVRNFWPRIPD